MDRAAYLERTRRKGVNPLLYWIVRGTLQPFFHLYFRMTRVGREHVLHRGPMIIAANHRSFLDPFVIGTIVRRPVYFVAKQELFRRPLVAWFLNSLGAFPIDRGNGDGDAMAAAREILERGDVVMIFPEGTRTRPGALGIPKRGVGRLALETGAPVLPVAILGTEAIRRGWRIRPHKVRVRCGSALRFPHVEHPSPDLARAVTERIWPCVALQWEWLGGRPPIRRAAVVGTGHEAARVGAALREANIEVADGDLVAQDLVWLAVEADELPETMSEVAAHIPEHAAVVVGAGGLVDGELPAAFVARRCRARAVASVDDAFVVAGEDRGLNRELAALLAAAAPAPARVLSSRVA